MRYLDFPQKIDDLPRKRVRSIGHNWWHMGSKYWEWCTVWDVSVGASDELSRILREEPFENNRYFFELVINDLLGDDEGSFMDGVFYPKKKPEAIGLVDLLRIAPEKDPNHYNGVHDWWIRADYYFELEQRIRKSLESRLKSDTYRVPTPWLGGLTGMSELVFDRTYDLIYDKYIKPYIDQLDQLYEMARDKFLDIPYEERYKRW